MYPFDAIAQAIEGIASAYGLGGVPVMELQTALALVSVYPATWLLQMAGMAGGGLAPRDTENIHRVVTAQLAHRDLLHLASNAMPQVVLITMFLMTEDHPWPKLAAMFLLGGSLTWLLGTSRQGAGIGGSIMSAALLGWLMMEFTIGSLAPESPALIAVLWALFLYLSRKPLNPVSLSGQGHLAGLVSGVAVAWAVETGRWVV